MSTAGRAALAKGTDAPARRVMASARTRSDRYARDPFAHLTDEHVWLQEKDTVKPALFLPYPHQEELIRAWVDLDYLTRTGELRFRNVHEEKSRQMGVTWAVAYVALWALAHHQTSGLAMSMKAAEIDNGGGASTPASFFGRVRYMVQVARTDQADPTSPLAFPATLTQAFEFVGGQAPLIRNLARGSYVTGTGQVQSPGRGMSLAFAFLDECARIPWGNAVQASIVLACPTGRLYNSTPYGEENLFYRLRELHSDELTYLRHHWTQHPMFAKGLHVAGASKRCKLCTGTRNDVRWDPEHPTSHRFPGKPTSPWYDDAIAQLTDEDVASELEIDYAASLTERVYPEFSEEFHVANVPIPWERDLSHKTELSIDYGVGTTSVTICQDAPREYRIIGEVELHDTLPEEVCLAIRRELLALGVDEMLIEPEWTRRMLFIGDVAGNARQQATGRPLIDEYARFGFQIDSRAWRIEPTIRAVKRLLLGTPKPLVVSPRCRQFIRHVKHNRWPVDSLGNRKPGNEPLNDLHSHMLRGFAYLAAWKFPPPSSGEAITNTSSEYLGDPATGKIDPGIRYDMEWRVDPCRYNRINGDLALPDLSRLRRAEEVSGVVALPFLRSSAGLADVP